MLARGPRIYADQRVGRGSAWRFEGTNQIIKMSKGLSMLSIVSKSRNVQAGRIFMTDISGIATFSSATSPLSFHKTRN